MNKILLDLRDLRDGASARTMTQDVESLELCRHEYVFHSPVRLDLEITKSESEILISGEISVPAQVECARCACVFGNEIKTRVKSRYIRVKGTPERDDASADSGVFQIRCDDATLDLTDEVRQAILVSLPIRALCSPDCKGLCTTCGANLNEGECSCRPETGHPAWEALDKLRNRSQQE